MGKGRACSFIVSLLFPSTQICSLLILQTANTVCCTDLGVRSLLLKQSRIGVNTAAQLLSCFRQLSESASTFRRRKVSRRLLFLMCVWHCVEPQIHLLLSVWQWFCIVRAQTFCLLVLSQFSSICSSLSSVSYIASAHNPARAG